MVYNVHNSIEFNKITSGYIKTLARPPLSYASESWTVRGISQMMLILAEVDFMRRAVGHTIHAVKDTKKL